MHPNAKGVGETASALVQQLPRCRSALKSIER